MDRAGETLALLQNLDLGEEMENLILKENAVNLLTRLTAQDGSQF